MTPRSFPYQQIESHQIWIDPIEKDGVDGIDYFGNRTRHIAITVPHKMMLVHAESTVALTPRYDLAEIKGTLPWESLRDLMHQGKDAVILEACRYLYASPHVNCSTELEHYARISYTAGRPQLDAALELTQRIYDEFELIITRPIFNAVRGCTERPSWRVSGFAQLMIGCLRSLACRHVMSVATS